MSFGSRAEYAAAARLRADELYAGVVTPHRSCGIALAETFGLPAASYQSLRRGGLTGEGTCGAIVAGLLVLGELLGDPDPTGPPTEQLKRAAAMYRASIAAKVDHAYDTSCNTRVGRFPNFGGDDRKAYCTSLAATVAETVAEVLWDLEAAREIVVFKD